MFRNPAMMSSFNNFAGAHGSAPVTASGNYPLMAGAGGIHGLNSGTLMGGLGLHQTGNAAVPASTNVSATGIGHMLGGASVTSNWFSGPAMGNIGLHQTDASGVPASAGTFGLGSGAMMGSLISDIPAGSDGTSTVAPGLAQVMLDIMDDMPGIHLVGLPPMGPDFPIIG